MKKRDELLERGFAHCLETGAMRRVYLRGRENILKRYLVHVAGFNLSPVMRQIFGAGTSRGLRGRFVALAALWRDAFELRVGLVRRIDRTIDVLSSFARATRSHWPASERGPSSTGC